MKVALKHQMDLESNDSKLFYRQLYQHNVNYTLYRNVQPWFDISEKSQLHDIDAQRTNMPEIGPAGNRSCRI